MTEQVYCLLDYETRSKRDIKKSGSHAYANDPSTRILCVAWRIGTKKELRKKPIKCWSPFLPPDECDPIDELIGALADPNIVLVAHNAFFEQVITRFVLISLLLKRFFAENLTKLISNVPISRWRCTAARAAAKSLPRNLEEACQVLGLPVQKDMEGRKVMLKLSKPRKPTKNNPSIWHSSKKDLLRLMAYCRTDIAAETELFLTVEPLTAEEQKVWELDQKINWRGFRADRPLVLKILRMIGEEKRNLDREVQQITGGRIRSANQRDELLKEIRRLGFHLPNMQAQTLDDAISAGMVTGPAKRLIQIRRASSKTSLGKYPIFELRTRFDDRVRDTIKYYAAHTGRFGGVGLQPHNFPKGNIKDTGTAAEVCHEGDVEWVRTLYGDPMNVFSCVLRAVLQAPPGRKFAVADWAGIEARIVMWLAGHESGLRAFRENRDLYIEMAAVIYGILEKNITPEQRQTGKMTILGAGFGMGWKTFMENAWKQFRVAITEELAKKSIQAYRTQHRPVALLWSNLERAAIAAVANPGKKYSINKTSWYMRGKWLICKLPSGRELSYFGPEIKQRQTPWGETRPVLYYWRTHPKTKKWVFHKTWGGALTENAVQAVARDLMVSAMLRLDDEGVYDVDLSVHDELKAEFDEGKGSASDFEKRVEIAPAWADGLPVKVAAWEGQRYKKG